MELTEKVRNDLLKLPTGNIADNNNTVPGQGVMDSGIRPLDRKMRMIGRAYTVRCYPGDNLALHQGIYAAAPGDVLILDCHGYSEAGHFGDIMATACMCRGIAGVVIDGSCRDKNDIIEMGFPMFVRGTNPSGTVKESPGKLGVPVVCGGVLVRAGDIVFGDCDGVVVVPKEDEDNVFKKALAKYDKERHIEEELKKGKTTLEIFGFDALIKSRSQK